MTALSPAEQGGVQLRPGGHGGAVDLCQHGAFDDARLGGGRVGLHPRHEQLVEFGLGCDPDQPHVVPELRSDLQVECLAVLQHPDGRLFLGELLAHLQQLGAAQHTLPA